MIVAHARNRINPFSQIDTSSYLLPGRNLLFHGSFVFQDGQPYLSRTPGYPLFLALTTLPGMEFAVLVQVILSALTVVLVWRLARGIFEDDRIALLSAWIGWYSFCAGTACWCWRRPGFSLQRRPLCAQ